MSRYFGSVFATVVLSCLFLDSAFASKVITTENKNVRPNAGIFEASAVSVSDEPGLPGSLSGATSFSFVISSESSVRFSRTSANSVVLSSGSVRSVSVSDDLRTLRFETSAPLASGVSFSVSGIKVIAYNRYSPLRGFDLDVGSDGTVDAYDPNGVRVTDEYGTPDTNSPEEPASATGTFSSGSVSLTANPSGDLDFAHFRVVFETASGTEVANRSEAVLSNRAFDIAENVGAVRVQSVDNAGNVSLGIVLRKPLPVAETPSGSASSSGSTSTDSGAFVPSGSGSASTGGTSTGSTAGASSSGALPPLYVPAYQRSAVTNVIAAMDRFVLAHAKRDAALETAAVRTIRNDLAKLFESFYRTRIVAKKRLLAGQIRTKVAALKSELLK